MSTNQNRIIQGYLEADARVENMRRNKRLRLFHNQMEKEQQMQQAAEEAVCRRRAAEREELLAQTLATQKQNALREEKHLQLIREDAPELRELKAKLDAQKLNYVRKHQIEQAKTLQQTTKETEMEAFHKMEAARKAAVEKEEEKKLARRVALEQQKLMQEAQMQERDRRKLEDYRDFMKEKQDVDDVVEKIRREEQHEMDEKRQKMINVQKSFQNFVEERAQVKQRMREEAEEEERKIVDFMKLRNKREADHSEKKKAKQAEAERILAKQTRMIEEDMKRKLEMENLFMEYEMEVKGEKEKRDEQGRKERLKQMRQEMNEQNQIVQRFKLARMEAEKHEEAKFRDMMQEQFAASEKLERENAVVRAQRRKEMFQDVSSLLEERRQLREDEKRREIEAYQREQQKEQQRQKVVEQAKEQMLQEHFRKLKEIRGY